MLSPAIPNITGEFDANEDDGNYTSGAFYVSSPNNRRGSGNSDNDNATIYFNASRCSKIYRDDFTSVQPAALCFVPQIKF